MITIEIKDAKKCQGDYSLYLSFPYNINIINIIRNLPYRYWHNEDKIWEVPLYKLDYLKDEFGESNLTIIDKDGVLSREKETVDISNLNHKFKIKPFNHQIEGFEYGMVHDKWLLADEPGCISGLCKVKIKERGKKATRQVTLAHLMELFEKDNTIQIKCMVNEQFGYMPIKKVINSGIKDTIRITLEDTYIECTKDHLIYTENGWIEASKLTTTQSVFTNGIQVCPICGTSEYKNHIKHGGIYEHHQVWYENTGHVVDTSKEIVHHKNGIKSDNRFENLQLMTIREHDILHSDVKKSHLYQFNKNLDYVVRSGTKIYLKPRLQKITKIEHVGNQEVFDVVIDDDEIHNFICNNIVVHNCGKSAQVINIATARRDLMNYKHCLIICGLNTLKWNWVEEIEKHSWDNAYILGQRTKRNGKIVVNSDKDKIEDLQNFEKLDDYYFLITNIESFRNDKIVTLVRELCKKGEISMIAIDESHKCLANTTSTQGKNTLKLQAPCMIAMTGTPLLNSPMDLYGVLKWLGYEEHSNYAFKNHYCEMGGYGNYQIVGYKNLGELQARLQEIQLRRLKSDVLDLPDKIYVNELIEMSPKQSKVYNEILGDLRINIDKIKAANNPLTEMIRLRQATGFTGILSSTVQESSKMDRMEEIVEEAIANKNKVVIFSNWTNMTNEIYKRLSAKYHGVQITGEIKDEDRQSAKDIFQNDPKCMFLVGTSGAMGVGITLTAAHVEIFMDIPWNKGSWEQCIDRCHRIGQTENLTIYNLMCKDTIDEKIYNLVERKGAMSDLLVDGVVKDKGAIVDYLLS